MGALQYAGVHTRPDICAKIGEVQAPVTKACVSDLAAVRLCMKQKPIQRLLPIHPKDFTLCAFSDASFLSSKHSKAVYSSSGDPCFCNHTLNLGKSEIRSSTCSLVKQKVSRSTLSAEAVALSTTVDRLLWLRILWAWLEDPGCERSSPEEVLRGRE